MEEKKKIETIKISVDCERNDREDIKCGGPEYLGFDFYVEKDKVDEMMAFIRQTFQELGLYFERIYANKDNIYLKNKAWDKKRIHDCIVSEADVQTHRI